MDQDVRPRIQEGWNNWRSASGVLFDKKVPLRLKGKFHWTVVRPAMLYGTETASIKKLEEKKMGVAETKILRWMSGVTREDRIRNEYIRGSRKVTDIAREDSSITATLYRDGLKLRGGRRRRVDA